MFEAKVTVHLKKGISDPEGANTLKAIHLLGFMNVQQVKTIRTFDLLIDGADEDQVRRDVEQICQRLLTNPVIHQYDITVEEKK
ncbi:MAG: phosphoribosylformylglycinamidine synthase [Thermoplasmata archaeon M11B2D]|nr:MAG: phosphoribosylformylglycinamidine synthase [Thermoplasmata archaeon M11B2D]PNX50069.1 MAG: phosphoribosylformylglycinamidine synthase [Thermoplasmata archaeon M9B2D]